MLLLTTLMAMLIGACAYAVRPSIQGGLRGHSHRASAEVAPPAPYRPESLEGVLVEQLAEGVLTRHQYRCAVELLAARDHERHPLVIPPELGNGA